MVGDNEVHTQTIWYKSLIKIKYYYLVYLISNFMWIRLDEGYGLDIGFVSMHPYIIQEFK